MNSLNLATGESRNSGCEENCCIYNPKRCGLSIPSAVRLLVAIQSVLSILEMVAMIWIFIHTYIGGRDPERPLLKPSEGEKRSPVRYLEIISIVGLIGNIVRLSALIYLFRSLKNITSPGVITARGLWLCNTTFAYIFLTVVVFATDSVITSKEYITTGTGNWILIFVCRFLYVLIGLDVLVLFGFGLCVVEHYRRMVLRANLVDLEGWAERDNAKYRKAPTALPEPTEL